MGVYDQDFELPFTHVRVVACRLSYASVPALLEIVRTEVVIDDAGVAIDAPRSLDLASFVDEEGEGSPWQVTPKLLVQTLWTPGPPHVVASFGSDAWELFPAPFTAGVARIELARICKLLWPDTPVDGAGRVVERLGLEAGLVCIPRSDPETPLQLEVRRTTLLLVFVAVTLGSAVVSLRDAVVGPRAPWNQDVLGGMAPDQVMQALVDLSARGQPASVMPGPCAPDEAWSAVPTADLLGVGEAGIDRAVRMRADAELGRRTREARQPLPGLLLRHTGPLRRT